MCSSICVLFWIKYIYLNNIIFVYKQTVSVCVLFRVDNMSKKSMARRGDSKKVAAGKVRTDGRASASRKASVTKASKQIGSRTSAEKAKNTKKSAAAIAKSVQIAKQEKRSGTATRKAKEIEYRTPDPEIVALVETALGDGIFIDYISKNVGSHANGLLKRLLEGPQKDEALAEKAEIKLNEVRRALNLLNKYGMVRYDVKRDSSGWLTFEWHVDYVAFSDFYKSLNKKTETKTSQLPEGCNDFFVCVVCSERQGFVYPFDIAYDKSFKCNCGKSLEAITRKDAEEFVRK